MYPLVLFAFLFLLSFTPLLRRQSRTRFYMLRIPVIGLVVMLSLILMVLYQIPFLLLFGACIALFIASEKRLYTKQRALIIAVPYLLVFIAFYQLYKDDPDYVYTYIQNNPKTTSLYVAKDGDPLIDQSIDTMRPLLSMSKLTIAAAYAEQVADGRLDPAEPIALDTLAAFYVPDYDGGAHPLWLEQLETDELIDHDTVPLEEVARGMIRYSSNANADYLLSRISPQTINEHLNDWGLTNHENIQPFGVAQAISVVGFPEETTQKETYETLKNMSSAEYEQLLLSVHEQVRPDGRNFENETIVIPPKLGKLWAERTTRGTAKEYGEFLHKLYQKELLTPEANQIMQELITYPEVTLNDYTQIGGKGGSSSSHLNNALAFKGEHGAMEVVILTEKLNWWNYAKMKHNMDHFIFKLADDEAYLREMMGEE